MPAGDLYFNTRAVHIFWFPPDEWGHKSKDESLVSEMQLLKEADFLLEVTPMPDSKFGIQRAFLCLRLGKVGWIRYHEVMYLTLADENGWMP